MTDRRESGDSKRRVLVIFAGTLALLLGSATAGFSYWRMQGNATITVTAGRAAPPTLTCTNITNGVRLDWAPNPQHGVTGYQLSIVTRHPKYPRVISLFRKNLDAESNSYEYTNQLNLGSEKERNYRLLERVTGVKTESYFMIKAQYHRWGVYSDRVVGGLDPSLSRVKCN